MNQVNEGFTRAVAQYIVAEARNEAKGESLNHAKIALLDWVGVSIAARTEPLVSALMKHAEKFGGLEQSNLVGHDMKCNAPQAALINGAMSHALDYDDNLTYFMGHPTVTIMPAVLAIGQWRGASGREILGAYLCGLRVGAWIAQTVGNEHYKVGFHGTSTIGRQAAAAACAYLLELNETQALNALGIAGTLANGVKQSFGTMAKPLHAGIAAEGGVTAASLAEDGFEAAHDIYEGPLGFIATHHGLNDVVDRNFLGQKHPVEFLDFKFHAACFFLHGALNIAQRMKTENAIASEDIASITVDVSQISCDTAGKTDPVTGLDGKFSMKYSLANAIVTGETGVAGYTEENIQNPETRSLMTRINVRITDEFDTGPLKARVNVMMEDGREFIDEADPTTETLSLDQKRDKLRMKFDDLCSPVIGEAQTKDLFEAIDAFDQAATPDAMLELTMTN